jgi:hypothetical protein
MTGNMDATVDMRANGTGGLPRAGIPGTMISAGIAMSGKMIVGMVIARFQVTRTGRRASESLEVDAIA